MTAAGFYLGSIPWVHKNLEKVVLLIVFLSVLPIGIEYLRKLRRAK
jgi:membrane-associated protein